MSGPGPPDGHRRSRLAVGLVAVAAVLLLAVPPGAAARPLPAVPAAGGASAPSTTYDSVGGWTTLAGSANRSGYTPFGGPLSGTVGNSYCPSLGLPIRAGPVAAGPYAYVADEFGTVMALNRTDLDKGGGNGTIAWTASVATNPTTPDVSSGELVVGDNLGNVTALNLGTGAVRWVRTLNGSILQGVAAVGGEAYVATGNREVAAISLADGALAWSTYVNGSIAGAAAVQSGRVYVTTTDGTLVALSATTGAVDWSVPIGGPTTTGPAVYGGRVAVVDTATALSVWSATNGSLAWRWNGSSAFPGDRAEASPTITGTTVVLQTHEANLYGFNVTNGALRWNQSNGNFGLGYPALSVGAASPTVAYLYDATQQLKAISLASGRVLWRASFNTASYGPVAIDSSEAMIADETGCLHIIGNGSSGFPWPVSGRVTDPNGSPLAGVQVSTGLTSVRTNGSGEFSVPLPNGSYTLLFLRVGYASVERPVLVQGPVTGLLVVLTPLVLFPLTGRVIDSYSGLGLANVSIQVDGIDYFVENATSGPGGAFEVRVPAGPVELSAAPSPRHANGNTSLVMPAGPLSGVLLGVAPTDLAIPPTDPDNVAILLPLAAIALVGVTVAVVAARARRVSSGLSPGILSPFARYVLQKGILLPVQLLFLLTLLYIFGTFLPAAASQLPVCMYSAQSAQACGYCPWSNLNCVTVAFGSGYLQYIGNLFTGNWGITSYGHLTEPAWTFFAWYVPYSVELAVVALGISAVAAYFLGLQAGWNRDRPVDVTVRAASAVGLLIPSFLVVLVLFTAIYGGFQRTFGDTPFGVLPAPAWFEARGGGVPHWIGLAYNTMPTGFPIVDAVLNRAWAVALVAFAKTLVQAVLIAAIYVPLFLRFARNAVAKAAEEPNVVAARARGIPEATIRWRHTGRRVVPIFLLTFAATLPLYVGTQSLVEAMVNDNGVGSLLLSQMTSFLLSGFGFHAGPGLSKPGNFYQVTIFTLVAVVLVGTLASEILARYLDPRAGRKESA